MPTAFKLPDPGEGVHEAEVIEVLVSEGDEVEEGQSIAEIETDKATTEVPAPVTGIVKEIRIKTGDVVAVGDVLMVFLEEGESEKAEAGIEEDKEPEEAAEAETEPEAEKEKKEKETAGEPEQKEEKKEARKEAEEPKKKAKGKRPVPATPSTRRLARELNVDLMEVEPSGPGGRVMPEDVEAHAKKPKEAPKPEKTPKEEKEAPPKAAPQLPDFSRWGPVERIPFRSIRRATAKRMVLSWENIPHVAHQDIADITELEAFRRENKAEVEASGGALTLTVFALKATIAALKAHPRFNASLDMEAEEIVVKKYYHIGIAVDTDRGLLVPVIRDVDCKSITDLAKEMPELAERTRQGETDLEEMTGGTFTVTNVGPLGGTGFSPMINFPQTAILGLAKARLQPVIQGDMNEFQVAARLMLPLCMAFDHRVVDGADAARFLREIIALLENPKKLMMT
jgi:pyruvate dehydrogenase E2 component (dihydrolipoamide acetyltransferase)